MKAIFIAVLSMLYLSSCSEEPAFSDNPIIELVEPRIGHVELIFLAGEQAWIANKNGDVFISSNSGTHWKHYPTPSTTKLKILSFTKDGENGMLVDQGGLIHTTANSGATWRTRSIIPDESANNRPMGASAFQVALGSSIDTMYLIWDCNIYFSENTGENWINITTKLNNTVDNSCIEFIYLNTDQELSFAAVSVSGKPHSLLQMLDNGNKIEIACPQTADSEQWEYYPDCPDNIVAPVEYSNLYFDREELNKKLYNTRQKIFKSDSYKPSSRELAEFSNLGIFASNANRIWFHYAGELAYSDNMEHWQPVAKSLYDEYMVNRSINSEIIQFGEILYTTKTIGSPERTYFNRNSDVHWNVLQDSKSNTMQSVKILESMNLLVGATTHRLLSRKRNQNSWTEINRFDSEIDGFQIAGDIIWVLHGNEEQSILSFSDDGGNTWVSSEALDLHSNYPNWFECVGNSCIIIRQREILHAKINANSDIEIIKTLNTFSGEGKHYKRDFILSKDLKTVWFTNALLLAKTTDYGATWEVILEGKIHFDASFVSPSRNNALFFVRKGRTLIPYRLIDKQWKKQVAIKFPEHHFTAYTHYTSAICWIDDQKALLTTEGESLEPLYAATNDGGTTWERVEINSAPGECWRENDKLLLDSYKVSISK